MPRKTLFIAIQTALYVAALQVFRYTLQNLERGSAKLLAQWLLSVGKNCMRYLIHAASVLRKRIKARVFRVKKYWRLRKETRLKRAIRFLRLNGMVVTRSQNDRSKERCKKGK